MSLSEIKDKLYKNNGKEDREVVFDNSGFDPLKVKTNSEEAGFKETGDVWKEKPDEIREEKNKALKIGGIALAIIFSIAFLVVGFYLIKKASFSEDGVTIEVNGSREASSGEKLSYEIVVKNNNRATLKNSVLKINYPESFVPESNSGFSPEGTLGGSFNLGDINGKEEKRIAFSGKVFSPKGTIVYLKTELIFSPSGFTGQFFSQNQFGLNVVSSPIKLDLMGPQNIASGDSLDYLISYKNEGNETYDGIQIKMEYPIGFSFSDSEPLVSEGNNIWYIGKLSPGQEGKITISGRLDGNKDDVKYIKVYVGEVSGGQFIAQNEEKAETKIGASPLFIKQTVNGASSLNVNAGEILRFQIEYGNGGEIGLKDVIIMEKIDNVVLDYKTLKLLNGGTVDSKKNTITWRASDVPGLKNLKPGESGIIGFEIKVKDIIPINNIQDKNFIISSIAKIDSPDIQTPIQGNKIVAGNRMDIKLNSKMFLGVNGFYYDAFAENSGPIPPKINQETTYIIKWTVNNVSNDVSEAKVESTLPGGVSFTGKIYPENSNLTFNERTNSIVWDIGNLSAATGILTASKEVSFQVKLIPAPSQEDDYANLLNQAVLSGKDLYTGENLSYTAEAKTTNLPEDKKIDISGYKIKK